MTPAWGYLTTGESNAYGRRVGDMWTESAMLVADTYTGRTDRTNALKWGVLNAAYGGPLGTALSCTYHCGFMDQINNAYGGEVAEDIFIALPSGDPTTSLPSDLRPSFPIDLYNGSFNQHIIVRNSWDQSGTLFSYYCPNTLTDHEHQFCGRFDIFSNNEFITKGRTEFTDYNDVMSTAPGQNIASIANSTGTGCTQATDCYFWPGFAYGGQQYHSYQAGLVTLQHAELPDHVAAIVDTTNEYNGAAAQYPSYNDVLHASRSLVYLRETNQVVFYDRAFTGHAGSKSVYQVTTGPITITGNTAGWLTRSGKQKAFFTSLLPSSAVVSDAGLISSTSSSQAADWEPYTAAKVDAGSPLSTQFLSVLEWGGSSSSRSNTKLVQSAGGTTFDGALVGSAVVMFMRAWPATFSTVSYPASGPPHNM